MTMRMTVKASSISVASVSTRLPAHTASRLTGLVAAPARLRCYWSVASVFKSSKTSLTSTVTGNPPRIAGVGKGKWKIKSNENQEGPEEINMKTCTQ